MKILLSKNQWEQAGKKAGWIKTSHSVQVDKKEYYVERIPEGFNIWKKINGFFYNIASLFDGQWDVSSIEKSVHYSQEEIIDEIETPLTPITEEQFNQIMSSRGQDVRLKQDGDPKFPGWGNHT